MTQVLVEVSTCLSGCRRIRFSLRGLPEWFRRPSLGVQCEDGSLWEGVGRADRNRSLVSKDFRGGAFRGGARASFLVALQEI